ncbi:MAG: hypothetical protein KAS17_09835, partial [Victivallaceae bacterium]|nr:hypothetical protein [Victivallaceae bacterium]
MKVFLILCLAVTSLSVFAEPYEVLLHTQPQGADAYISLIHPFNAPGMTNYGIANNYFDCEPALPNPDWGVKNWKGDNPKLNSNYTSGARIIKATTLNDIGDCWVRIRNTGAISVTCIVEVANWPNISPPSFTNIMNSGDIWNVTNLPCTKSIGL